MTVYLPHQTLSSVGAGTGCVPLTTVAKPFSIRPREMMAGTRSSDQDGAGKEAPQEVWRAELTPERERCARCSRWDAQNKAALVGG